MTKYMRLFTDRNMAIVFAMGFASGLPLLLTGSTLQAWCKLSGLTLTQIGLFSLVSLPYTLKFVWAPIVDRYVPPLFGRRRGWLMITQVALMLALVALSLQDPRQSTMAVVILALIITFVSATQDIVIDAYRREILPTESFGFGFSLAITGYRIGMLLAGAGALILADHVPWSSVYLIMAGAMGIGLLTSLLAPEPQVEHAPPRSLKEAVVDPFKDFFSRSGALWVLAFILLYKVGDNMATAITTPFYMEMGYSLTSIGALGKTIGLSSTIIGGLIGGAAMMGLGMRRSLWIFGVLQGLGNLGFAWLSLVAPSWGASTAALGTVIAIENLTAGMGTAAFTAFMASLTNKRFTATQYALFSSLMSVPRVIVAAPTGWMASHMGWTTFFVVCTLCAIPGMFLLFKVGSWAES